MVWLYLQPSGWAELCSKHQQTTDDYLGGRWIGQIRHRTPSWMLLVGKQYVLCYYKRVPNLAWDIHRVLLGVFGVLLAVSLGLSRPGKVGITQRCSAHVLQNRPPMPAWTPRLPAMGSGTRRIPSISLRVLSPEERRQEPGALVSELS